MMPHSFIRIPKPQNKVAVHCDTPVPMNMAVTFWGEQAKSGNLPGLSAVGDEETPYRKSSKFTMPQSDLRTDVARA